MAPLTSATITHASSKLRKTFAVVKARLSESPARWRENHDLLAFLGGEENQESFLEEKKNTNLHYCRLVVAGVPSPRPDVVILNFSCLPLLPPTKITSKRSGKWGGNRKIRDFSHLIRDWSNPKRICINCVSGWVLLLRVKAPNYQQVYSLYSLMYESLHAPTHICPHTLAGNIFKVHNLCNLGSHNLCIRIIWLCFLLFFFL